MVTKFFDMVKLMLYKYRKQIISILAAIPLLWGIYLLVKPDTDIHIAVVGPMSGKDSANGKSYLEGVKLYVTKKKRLNRANKRAEINETYEILQKPAESVIALNGTGKKAPTKTTTC